MKLNDGLKMKKWRISSDYFNHGFDDIFNSKESRKNNMEWITGIELRTSVDMFVPADRLGLGGT